MKSNQKAESIEAGRQVGHRALVLIVVTGRALLRGLDVGEGGSWDRSFGSDVDAFGQPVSFYTIPWSDRRNERARWKELTMRRAKARTWGDERLRVEGSR